METRFLSNKRAYFLLAVNHLSYTVRIPIFLLADLHHVILSCDETTFLTSLSWCNNRGVNQSHHCHYTIASADSMFDYFICSVFNLNNENVNALIARELSGFTCTRSLTIKSKFSIPHSAKRDKVLSRNLPSHETKDCVIQMFKLIVLLDLVRSKHRRS